MADRVFNFCAGPAMIPRPVLEQARDELVSLPGVGMSVMEISHRSHWFDEILEEAEENLRRIVGIPDDYRVLFLQGGSRLQFSMVPINFLDGGSADHLVTGYWASKAMPEASREGTARIAWTGKQENFVRVPEASDIDLDPDARYVHMTSNETIQGVQYEAPPETGQVPLICDASSDFLSRPIDVSDYGMVYACAQKNAGPAGLTVVVISDELLERRREGLHTMLDYRAHAEAGSRLNTPPTFAIYIFLLMTRWIEQEMGGLAALAERNRAKAQLLYEVLDESSFYRTHANPSSRSQMNVTFRLPDPELDAAFLEGAGERGLLQLKGHRSVGGMRASIYNAMPLQGVQALRDYLLAFEAEQ